MDEGITHTGFLCYILRDWCCESYRFQVGQLEFNYQQGQEFFAVYYIEAD